MPNTSSAKKALRQSKTRAARNSTTKLRLKRSLKTAAKETVAQTTSYIDKAVKQGLIHKNKAARMKSKLARTVGVATAKRPSAGKSPAKGKTEKPAAKTSTKKNV